MSFGENGVYQPKTSIVIPAYNASNFLVEAVDCEGFAAAIRTILDNACVGEKFVSKNLTAVKAFESNVIIRKMSDLYRQ